MPPSRNCNSVSRHGHALRPGLSYVTGIGHHSVPLLIIGLHTVRFFEHLAVSHDRFVQLLHVRPQSAICIPPAPLRPLLDLWIELLLASAWTCPAPSGQLPQRSDVPEPSPDRGSGQ